MAPELFKTEKFDRKADVYSFGILMYEVITDMIPYPELFEKKITDYEFKSRVMNDNYRPIFTFPIKESIQQLIEKCWSKEPSERPNFDEIFNSLSGDKNECNCILEDVDIDELNLYIEEICEVKDNTDHLLNKINELEKENQRLKTENELKDDKIEKAQGKYNQLKIVVKQHKQSEEQKEKEIQRLKQSEEQKDKEIQRLKQSEEQKGKEIQRLKQIEEQKGKEIQRLKQSEEQKDKETQRLRKNEEQKDKEIQRLKQSEEKKDKETQRLRKNEEQKDKEIQRLKQSEEKKDKETLQPKIDDKNQKEIQEFNSDEDEPFYRNSKSTIHQAKHKESTKKFQNKAKEERRDQDKNSKKLIKDPKISIEKVIINERNTVSEFNCQSLKMQHSILSNIVKSSAGKNRSFVNKVINLINVLLRLDNLRESTDVLELISPNSNLNQIDDETQIWLKFVTVESLINNKYFKSKELIDILKVINQLCFEIKYPNKAFDNIYNKVVNLRKSANFNKIVKIGIFISGIKKTDYKFKNNVSINYIILDFTVTSISGLFSGGSFCGCSSLTHITIPSSVTSIGDNVFYKCSSLAQISIPSSVTSIGNSAFYRCSSLTQISIPSSVTSIGDSAFCECSSLTQISIPSSIISIEGSSFSGCTSLTQISIPASVTSIANYAFYNCSSLNKISIPASITSIGDYSFKKCSSLNKISFSIPSSVVSIGHHAFSGCSSLTQVSIPSSVTKIDYEAFSYCSSLTQIAISSSATFIGYNTFNSCSSLKKVIFTDPSSVTSIGSYAFSKCTSLTQISIPSSVTSIGNDAFSGCSSLTKISIPSSLNKIEENPFIGCSKLNQVTIILCSEKRIEYFEDKFLIHKSQPSSEVYDRLVWSKLTIDKAIIPPFIKTIGSFLFYGCASLTKISIPTSVCSIGDHSFSKCSSLIQISFANPSSVTSIGNYAFYECSSLKQISIPSSVKSIGEHAFSGCSSLIEISIPSSFIVYSKILSIPSTAKVTAFK